ncbi:MAG: hypothetical protein GY771_03785 [bacterium]|nr:hypothetical protein [bacterium]
MNRTEKICFIVLFAPVLARGFTPGNLGADSSLAFAETESSFGLPGYDTLDEVAPDLPETLIEVSFAIDDDLPPRPEGLIGEEAKIGEYSYAEVKGGGGPGELYLDVFTGFEVDKIDVLGRFFEDDYLTGDSSLWCRNRTAEFGMMYSNTGGTLFGFNARYLARRDIPAPGRVRYAATDVDSGRTGLEYIGNIWNDTKLITSLSGSYSTYRIAPSKYRDYNFEANLGFNAFLWGDNLTRANVQVVQSTLELPDVWRTEALYGELSVNNDIPLTDWMNVGVGFTRYMYNTETAASRNYGYGALHFQIGSRTGLYVQYNPKLIVPVFQELYIENGFTRVYDAPLFNDTYFSVEAGIIETLSRNITAGITLYQTRSRSYPAALDYEGDIALDYYDAGRVRINGGTLEYSIDAFNFFDNTCKFTLEKVETESGGVLPYVPRDKVEFSLRFYRGDSYSLNTTFRRLGRRMYEPDAYFPPVYTLDVVGNVKLTDGLNIYLLGSNLLGEKYQLIKGILAPGRTFSLGAGLVL